MPKRRIDLRKILQPSDAFAFFVIVLGLALGLFIDEMAVRLIGVCTAILGGVALFMLISPRIADLSIEQSKRRTVSQPTQIGSDTRQDDRGVRIQFRSEDYRTEFGTDDGSGAAADKDQVPLFPDLTDTPAPAHATPVEPPSSARRLIGQQLGDGESGIRVVGVRGQGRKAAPPPLVIDRRAARGAQDAVDTPATEPDTIGDVRPQRREQPRATPTESRPARTERPITPERTAARSTSSVQREAFVTGVENPIDLDAIGDEVVLSDDVVVRKASKPRPSPEPVPDLGTDAAPQAATEQPTAGPIGTEPMPEVPLPDVVADTEPTAVVPPAPEETPAVTTVTAAPIPSAEPEGPTHRRATITVAIHDLVDDAEAFDHAEPRKEFDHLLNRVLQVIRSMVNARTAAFFWVNVERQQLVVESMISDVADGVFTTERKLMLGDDVVSQIAVHGRPEILTEIRPSAELDLLPYYTRPAGSASFIGVPVYFGGAVVGVLCADAKEAEAYDAMTVGFFGHFTKLISGLIQSYTGKYDLLQASRTLQAIAAVRGYVRERGINQESIIRALLKTTVESMDISTIGLVLYDGETGWSIAAARSVLDEYDALTGAAVDLDGSAVGGAITTGRSVVTYGTPGLIRVVGQEPQMDGGQFVAVPLSSFTNTFGALYVENPTTALTQQDITVLEAIGEHVGTFIEQLRTADVVQQGALTDEVTGILNRAAFQQRLAEEFARGVDYDAPVTVCLVRIDPYRDGDAGHGDRILQHVLDKLRHELRPYDVIGRIDTDLLGIALVGTKTQQARIWTERMRKDIAISIIDAGGKRFSVTVSIGVAEGLPQDSWEVLLDNAYHVLGISERQGNTVTVFS